MCQVPWHFVPFSDYHLTNRQKVCYSDYQYLNGFRIRYSDGDLNNGLFGYQAGLDHLNSELVRNVDGNLLVLKSPFKLERFYTSFKNSLGSILSTQIWVLRNFLQNPKFFQIIWEILRQTILVQLAGQISGNFPLNILIGKQFENLWNLSELREFGQNSDNFLLIGLSPGESKSSN